jgi:AraC-like DNA-binding protein
MATSVERRRDYTGREFGLEEVRRIGHVICSRAHIGLGTHAHADCIEICYLKKGRLHWWAENEGGIYEVEAGELVIVHPGEAHGGADDIHDVCDLYWVTFVLMPNRKLPGLTKEHGNLIRERLLAAPRHFSGNSRIVDYFEQMLMAIERPGPLSPMRARSALHQFILEVCDCASRDHQKAKDFRLEEIITKVKEDVTFFEDVSEMAEMAELSCNRFITLFRRYTGSSPIDFLSRERIQQAKQLLADRSKSVTDVAFHLNFSTTQYFATVFKKFTGMTPSKYQKETLG